MNTALTEGWSDKPGATPPKDAEISTVMTLEIHTEPAHGKLTSITETALPAGGERLIVFPLPIFL